MIINLKEKYEVRLFESNYSDEYTVAGVLDNIGDAWGVWYEEANKHQHSGFMGVQLYDVNNDKALAYSYRDSGCLHLD